MSRGMSVTSEAHCAHIVTHNAEKRGAIAKAGRCEICGAVVKTQWHHANGYDKASRLDVWELCPSCNILLRGQHDGVLDLEAAQAFVAERRALLARDAERSKKQHIDGVWSGFTNCGFG